MKNEYLGDCITDELQVACTFEILDKKIGVRNVDKD